MAVDAGVRAYVLDLFCGVGGVTARAMMGGLALYARGRIFAMVGPEDRIYLKAEGALAEALAREGAVQFTYETANGRTARMGYWSLPDTALDEPELACDWATHALDVDRPIRR